MVGGTQGASELHKLLELDLWFGSNNGPISQGLILIDSGASHNFLSEKVAVAAQLPIDRMCKLNVWLVNGETHVILGLARAVHITFAPRVVQTLDFWVVPLAMDLILGMSWLWSTQPTIDWGLLHVLWQYKGSVITVYNRGGLSLPPPTSHMYMWSRPSIFFVMQKMAYTRILHLLVCCNQPQQQTLWAPLVGLSVQILWALRGTKLLSQNYLQSLVMCSMPQVNPHMHVSSIVLI